MSPNSSLPIVPLQHGTALVAVQPGTGTRVTLQSRALDVMTDLTRVKAANTAPSTPLRHAEQQMIWQGVRMLFVAETMPFVVGLVTTNDLVGDRIMRVGQQRGLHYDELTVADVMTPLDALDAVDLGELRMATVANVIATLKRVGRNHLLVVDGQAPKQTVRGVVSRSQVERQLGHLIEMTEVANSFAEVGRLLA